MSKPKILYILPSWNRAGGETVVKNLIDNLPRENYAVSLLILSDEINAPMPDSDFIFYNGYGTPLLIKNGKLKLSFIKLYKTIKLINHIQPDLVHYHLIEDINTFIIPFIKIFSNTKSIVTIHTRKDYYIDNNFKSRLTLLFEKIMFSFVDRIIAVSRDEYEFLSHVFNKNKLVQINNGIDVNYYSKEAIGKIEKKDFGVENNTFLIIMIGRFVLLKNQRLAINALASICTEYPNVKLLFIGGRGDQESNYRSLVRKLNLEKNILFLGELDDVRPILKVSDLGLFLSFREALSIGLLEMMSMGIPVILSDIPMFRNMFDKNENLIFVDPFDPEQLSEAIISLSNNEQKRLELAEHLRKTVFEKYSVEKQISEHLYLYDLILTK